MNFYRMSIASVDGKQHLSEVVFRIFGTNRDESGEWRMLHNEELHSLYNTKNYHVFAPMGRFQLELFIFITYFFIVVQLTSCVFFPVGLSKLTRHFEQVL